MAAGTAWTVEAARERLEAEGLRPAGRADRRPELVPLEGALGRVLAAPVAAAADLPPFDRALVDGWAVAGDDPGPRPVAGEVLMGRPAPPCPPGAAVAVPTGGVLPPGADRVVLREEADLRGDRVAFAAVPEAGANVLRRGADARSGETLLPAGHRLRPVDVALLAAAAVPAVAVWPAPRVALLSTGDELVPPGSPPGEARVPDANLPALAACLRRDGAVPVPLGVAPDEPAAIRRAVEVALGCDALLCTGGTSVGDRDFVPHVLAEALGCPPLFTRLALRPGRPTAAFVRDGFWAVALPGHPVSSLVVYELLVRPLVARAAGAASARSAEVCAVLAAPVVAPADLELAAPVRLEPRGEGDGWRAVPLAATSATLARFARLDGLVRCRPGVRLEAGTLVTVRRVD
jgi:molybdopterin molybdotransferase